MTTVAHGTVSGYTHHRCRQDCCRRAKTRDQKTRRLAELYGVQYTLPAWPLQRRTQALACLGWSPTALETETGVSYRVIDEIRAGRQARANTKTDRALRAGYDRLCMTIGPAPRTAAHARRQGWAPPLAWNDIDGDPTPQTAPVNRMGPTHQIHIEDIEDAITWGYDTYEQVADRLGVHIDSIYRCLHRHDRGDLQAKLRKDNAA